MRTPRPAAAVASFCIRRKSPFLPPLPRIQRNRKRATFPRNAVGARTGARTSLSVPRVPWTTRRSKLRRRSRTILDTSHPVTVVSSASARSIRAPARPIVARLQYIAISKFHLRHISAALVRGAHLASHPSALRRRLAFSPKMQKTGRPVVTPLRFDDGTAHAAHRLHSRRAPPAHGAMRTTGSRLRRR